MLKTINDICEFDGYHFNIFNPSIEYYSHTFPVYQKFMNDFLKINNYIDNAYSDRDIIQAITVQEKMFLESYSTCKDFHDLKVPPVMYNHGELRLFKIVSSNKLFDYYFFSYKVDKDKTVTSVFIDQFIGSKPNFDNIILRLAIDLATHYTDYYLNKEFNAPLNSRISFGNGNLSFLKNDIFLEYPYTKTDILLILDYHISIFNCLKGVLNRQKIKKFDDIPIDIDLKILPDRFIKEIFKLVFDEDLEDVSKYTELAVKIFEYTKDYYNNSGLGGNALYA